MSKAFISARGRARSKSSRWQGGLMLITALFFLCPGPAANSAVLTHNNNIGKYVPQNRYRSIWQIGPGTNGLTLNNLVEFNKSQFSLLEESLGDVSVESFQLSVIDNKPANENRSTAPVGLTTLDTNLFLDALSDSATLRTIYFNSQQLKFSFRLNLMSLIGDELVKDELAENRRRQIENENRLDPEYSPDVKSARNYNNIKLLETIINNLNIFLIVTFLVLLLLYLLLRFFSKRI